MTGPRTAVLGTAKKQEEPMHTSVIAESEGDLDGPESSDRLCRTCAAPMACQTWDSSCGGYTDYKYTCPNGHVEWVDGPDA